MSARAGHVPDAKTLCLCFLIATLLGLHAEPAAARIVKSKSLAQRPQELTVGAHAEIENGDYAVPFLIEWAPTPKLKFSLEPAFGGTLADTGKWERGVLDTEASAVYEFMPERRNRPSVALQLGVKIPTASNLELGTKKTDFLIGVIAAKEYVGYDLELSAGYTFLGKPKGVALKNVFEVSLAGERHWRPRIDLLGELTVSTGGSVRRGSGLGGVVSASDNSGRTELELIAGIAERMGKRWKLEQGIAAKSEGTVQLLLGWEYEFGVER